jgi:deoxyadenosine/deoxycytidine kinase
LSGRCLTMQAYQSNRWSSLASRGRYRGSWVCSQSPRPLFIGPSRSFMSKPPRILKVALEGNIAAGKSTFLEIIGAEINVTCVPEPVSRWQNIKSEGGNATGGNILGMFYSDPSRWAYTFQSYAFLSRLKSQLEYEDTIHTQPAQQRKIIMFERSVLSDKNVFAANCHSSGLFSEVEWAMYCDWHAWLTSSFDTKLDGIIYLVLQLTPLLYISSNGCAPSVLTDSRRAARLPGHLPAAPKEAGPVRGGSRPPRLPRVPPPPTRGVARRTPACRRRRRRRRRRSIVRILNRTWVQVEGGNGVGG